MTDPGGDRPPASGAKTFSEWLAGGAPAQFAALLIVLFGRYLDLWLILTALAGLARCTGCGRRRPSRTAR